MLSVTLRAAAPVAVCSLRPESAQILSCCGYRRGSDIAISELKLHQSLPRDRHLTLPSPGGRSGLVRAYVVPGAPSSARGAIVTKQGYSDHVRVFAHPRQAKLFDSRHTVS